MSGARIFVAVVLVVFTCQCGSAPSSPVAAVTPTLTSAESAYVSLLTDDTDALDVYAFKKFTCKTRELCIGELQDIRGIVVAMVGDLDRQSPPDVFAQQVPRVRLAAQQLIGNIDSTLALMSQPNSNYVGLSGAIDVHPLDLAAGAIVCWPKSALSVELGESANGYVCR